MTTFLMPILYILTKCSKKIANIPIGVKNEAELKSSKVQLQTVPFKLSDHTINIKMAMRDQGLQCSNPRPPHTTSAQAAVFGPLLR